MPRRLELALLTLGITAFYLLTIRSGHVWGDDFVQYIQHALNLAAHEPYGAQVYVANPSLSIGPPAYPPVFPLMLFPILKVAGLNFAVLKVFMGLLFGIAFLSIALAFEEALTDKGIAALLLLLALSPTFWTFKEAVFSDVPFLIFCFSSLALIQRLVSTKRGPELYVLGLATGVMIYLACGTRSQGLPLLPTLLIADAWKAKRLRLAPLLACGVTLLLLVIQNRLVFTEAERLQYLSLDPVVVWSNVKHYAGSLSTYWDNGYNHVARYAVFAIASGLALLGYLRRLRQGLGPLEVFVPLFLLPLFFWVFQQGIRYLLPLLPLYIFYILEGARSIGARLRPRTNVAFQSALLMGALACFLASYSTVDLEHIDGPLDPEAQEMLQYIRAHTEPDDVILFEKPRLLGLLANRSAMIPTRVESAADDKVALRFYRSIGAKYLITGRAFPTDATYLRPFLSRNGDWARETWSNGEFQLWEIHAEPPNPPRDLPSGDGPAARPRRL
jgi:hypothetical protein